MSALACFSVLAIGAAVAGVRWRQTHDLNRVMIAVFVGSLFCILLTLPVLRHENNELDHVFYNDPEHYKAALNAWRPYEVFRVWFLRAADALAIVVASLGAVRGSLMMRCLLGLLLLATGAIVFFSFFAGPIIAG